MFLRNIFLYVVNICMLFNIVHCCRVLVYNGTNIGDKTSAWLSATTSVPAVVFTDWSGLILKPVMRFVTATDSTGLNWGEATVVPAAPYTLYGQNVEGMSLTNGSPLIFFQEFTGMQILADLAVTATDASGTSWNAPIQHGIAFDGLSDVLDWHAIMLNDGRPAFLHEDSDGFLVFRAATTPQATEFASQQLFVSAATHADIILLNDFRPAIVYLESTSQRVYFQTATSPAAVTWNLPFWFDGYTTYEEFQDSSMVSLQDSRILLVHRGHAFFQTFLYYSMSTLGNGGLPWTQRTISSDIYAKDITVKLLGTGRPIAVFQCSGLCAVTAKSPTMHEPTPWNPIMTLDSNPLENLGVRPNLLFLSSGVPMIVYTDTTNDNIYALIADDTTAASWNAPCQAPPTSAPTRAPSKAPVAMPTKKVTAPPTNSPTDAPTNAPTDAPLKSPTKIPTSSPSASPTALPTRAPSSPPTMMPVVPPGSPSRSPSLRPTARPTEPVTSATIDESSNTAWTSTSTLASTMSDSNVPTPVPTSDSLMPSSNAERDDTLLYVAFAIAALLLLCLIVAVICAVVFRRRSRSRVMGVAVDSGVRMSRRSHRSSGGRHQYGAAPRQSSSSRRSERRTKRGSIGLPSFRLDGGNSIYSIPQIARTSVSSGSTAYVELARKEQFGAYQGLAGVAPQNGAVEQYALAPSAALGNHYSPLGVSKSTDDGGYAVVPDNIDGSYTRVPNGGGYENGDIGQI